MVSIPVIMSFISKKSSFSMSAFFVVVILKEIELILYLMLLL